MQVVPDDGLHCSGVDGLVVQNDGVLGRRRLAHLAETQPQGSVETSARGHVGEACEWAVEASTLFPIANTEVVQTHTHVDDEHALA